MKKSFPLLIILATLTIIVGGVLFFGNKQNSSSVRPPLPSNLEYFWGDGCPHCAVVAEFFESWSGKDKIPLQKFEVWGNRENADLMLARAKSCGITPSNVGVPFLITPEGKCYSGDTPIIDYLKTL